MFSLTAVAFISLSSFTSFAASCRYRIYNPNTGQTYGYITIYNLPDNYNCGSPAALKAAVDAFND